MNEQVRDDAECRRCVFKANVPDSLSWCVTRQLALLEAVHLYVNVLGMPKAKIVREVSEQTSERTSV